MKTYEAITVISNHIIDDGLCDAIILKGRLDVEMTTNFPMSICT